MAKMHFGLMSGRYSQKEGRGIAPSMFKTMIAKGHPEFSTMRQQDAQEFLQHMLKIMEQKEKSNGQDPSAPFKFSLEQRLQCVECGHVKYVVESGSTSLQLPIGQDEANTTSANDIEYEQCLVKHFSDEYRVFDCPVCKKKTHLKFSSGFINYPDVLVTPIMRFVHGANYVVQKSNVHINCPDVIELQKFASKGPSSDESLFPEDNQPNEVQFDQASIDQIVGMGFPESRAKKALSATGNAGAEAAMNWLFEHMDDDPDEAEASNSNEPDEVQLLSLTDMGFTIAQAKNAMKATGNNLERAVDWLFSHGGDEAVEQPSGGSSAPSVPRDGGVARYELIAFISHKGTSAHCGHYVAHLKKDGKWILFNDEKVAEVPDVSIAKKEAYIYVFSRIH
ncbi:hypothetical protein HDU76_012384 [Blyttiomyces sp. JEL0837]|nr:hypothetical protein HDU76_012384 [Blyttiomyces sp. JEL0837]